MQLIVVHCLPPVFFTLADIRASVCREVFSPVLRSLRFFHRHEQPAEHPDVADGEPRAAQGVAKRPVAEQRREKIREHAERHRGLMAAKSPKYAHRCRSGIFGYLMFCACGFHVPVCAAVFLMKHGLSEALLTQYSAYFLMPPL